MEVRVARGVFAGMVSGAVVGGLGLATLSVVNGPLGEPGAGVEAISETPIVTPQAEAAPEPVADAATTDAATETAAEAMPEPQPQPQPAPAPEPLSEPADEQITQPLAETTAGSEVPAREEPASDPDAPDAAAGDAPVVPAEPAAPAEPEMSDVQPEADQGAGEVAGLVPEPDTQPAMAEAAAGAPRAAGAPAAPEASAPQPAPVTGEAAPSPTPLPQTEATLDPALSGTAPPEGEAIAALPSDDPAEVPASAPATVPTTLAEPSQPPGAPEGGEPPAPTRLKSDPIEPVGDLAVNVTTDRLPSIGGDDPDAEAAPELSAASPLAIERNAAGFDRPEGVPMMSVILRDDPAARAALGDLANLPFAVSFIVAAEQPDAAEAVAFYRGAGAEVLLSVQLPDGATAVDAEVTLQAHAGLLSDAVALQMGTEFQASGATATQVAQVLVEGGHGLVSLPQGLNTGHKSALKAGVPAGLVFRELDNDGQSPEVIRRFLDNAAFKARQERGVILLGHARAETLQALIEWSLGNRARSVAIAPVSAVLLDG